MVTVGNNRLKVFRCIWKAFVNVVWFFPEAFKPTAALVISVSAEGEQKLAEFVQDSGCVHNLCIHTKDIEKSVETYYLQIKSTVADKGLSNLSLYSPNDTEATASSHNLFQYLCFPSRKYLSRVLPTSLLLPFNLISSSSVLNMGKELLILLLLLTFLEDLSLLRTKSSQFFQSFLCIMLHSSLSCVHLVSVLSR